MPQLVGQRFRSSPVPFKVSEQRKGFSSRPRTSRTTPKSTRIDTRIVLINGSTLAKLMIDHGVGVTSVASYEVKRIDSDYFDEGAV
jgi:restriction endonuclease Mrr